MAKKKLSENLVNEKLLLKDLRKNNDIINIDKRLIKAQLDSTLAQISSLEKQRQHQERMIDILQSELNNSLKTTKELTERIWKERKVCDHTDEYGKSTYEYDGHDSRDDWYKCSRCGDTYH